MPMGATLALRQEDKGFIRESDGAKRRSSVPHGHFHLPGHFGWVNRSLYQDGPRLSWHGRGEELLRRGHRVKAS
jgi:hypothetical protein